MRFTDTEQAFADSDEGRAAIALARYKHDLGERHKGADARPWTDTLESNAVRELSAQHARQQIARTALLADCEREMPVLRAAAETARQKMIDDMNRQH